MEFKEKVFVHKESGRTIVAKNEIQAEAFKNEGLEEVKEEAKKK